MVVTEKALYLPSALQNIVYFNTVITPKSILHMDVLCISLSIWDILTLWSLLICSKWGVKLSLIMALWCQMDETVTLVLEDTMCMVKTSTYCWFADFHILATCGTICVVCVFIFCLSWGVGDPHTHPPPSSLHQADRQTDGQTDRLADRNIVTDILKYWTMCHSKFVFQPRDPTVWPGINTHPGVSPALYCTPVCMCVGYHSWRKEVDSQSLM